TAAISPARTHRQSTDGFGIGVPVTVGRVTIAWLPVPSATVYTVGFTGVAYPWSAVAIVMRNRCPASERRTIAGRVTVTGFASAMSRGRSVSRTGAMSPLLSWASPRSSTSYNLTNSTASPVGDAARMLTVGAPTTSTVDGSGSDRKVPCWPGRSVTTPLTNEARPPVDGTDEMAAGLPAAGLAANCGGPCTVTRVVP